jgi:hypothetical protein
MKITIPRHHRQLIENLSLEMGCSNSEALNWLIWNYRWGTPQPQPQQQPQAIFAPKSPQAIANFEQQKLQEEIDPIIAKFAELIEEF